MLLWFLLGFTSPAFCWGQQGHEAVAELAQTMLSNTVLTKVHAILGARDLASVAVWADEARQLMKYHTGPLTNDLEAKQFVVDHPDNGDWHFVDLPLHTFTYLPNGYFATNSDIVHALDRCISVLEGQSMSLTTTQALRYLIHLVGDVHQPLHVACGYYNFNPANQAVLIRGASAAHQKQDDQGANKLHYTTSQNLHHYWDVTLVENVANTTNSHDLATALLGKVQAKKWKTSGDHATWPAKWATASVKQADLAYQANLTFGQANFNPDGTLSDISIAPLPGDYATNQTARAADQLARAAFHLAELLNRINWP